MKLLPALTAMILVLVSSSLSANRLNLYTFHSPPYQVEQVAGEDPYAVHGTTVDSVRCIAQRSGWDIRAQLVPQNRAIHGLRTQTIDGYFAVDESTLLNEYALPTAPVALEKWYFYSLNPIDDYTNTRLAAIAGSNEALWLEDSPYELTMTVSHPRQLLALLERGRVDAVMLDQRVMGLLQLTDNGIGRLASSFIRFAPLHLYLNRRFVSEHPDFIDRFNRNIGPCVSSDFTLSQDETRTLELLAQDLMAELQREIDLEHFLSQPLRHEQLSDILNADALWQALAPELPSDLARELLIRPESKALATWKATHQPLITEVFVMDRLGANVALSQLTSDYWQGDEEKFQQIIEQPSGSLYLEPVYFDASTQTFQIIVSMPVRASSSDRLLGAIAIGLNIERALVSKEHPSPTGRARRAE